jgi:hypothetical protein
VIAPYIKEIACFVGYSVWEYWLGKTKKIAPNSTVELVEWFGLRLVERYLPKEKDIIMSGFSKVIQVGDAGQVSISEQGGVASVEVALSQQAGGGDVAGFAKASVSAKIEVSAHQLIDAGLELAKAKFPSAASIIDGAKVIIDAEIGKV